MAAAGLVGAGAAGQRPAHSASGLLVENVTRLYPVRVAKVVAPASVQDVVQALQHWPGPVAIGGARYSMGGQIGVEGGLHIDMRAMNALVWLDAKARTVRVQAGMCWRDLQDHLDPHDLAVRTMQSYANFTVGGSVSVNVHGRYVGHGPIGASVRALQIVLASGEVREACRQQHPDLFRAALGGYGGLGVVTEVELDLDANTPMERSVVHAALDDYPGFFAAKVRRNPQAVMHNADLLPPLFDRATAVTWSSTDKPVTVPERLVPRGQGYGLDKTVIWAMTELPGGHQLQHKVVRPALLRGQPVVWRNREASLDAASLEPASRAQSTYVLQEYFAPVAQFAAFTRGLARVLQQHGAQVLNISVRHAPPDPDAVMAWAREEVFSWVLYYKQGTSPEAQAAVGRWTRALIDLALSHGGTYYLPYQRHATPAQFAAAYPQADRFRAAKAVWDPQGRMTNMLWKQYL
ncbi:MAG: FAD-binding oxidoreductase [Gammaproteobacteria bacterium]|nr:FAD-binding oxidoreductase [Gammaproteobacteria bacterium]MBU1506679.1 FAD-binding oxidoreductase [Gammaproteobacteria bacterium]MBU2121645.1 FAD-binding oxidoreductase [Gammaproteobacteria bacterium]MBU2173277.1 FAD-binding oxidoreductase [Gammaproteobacteria bacterium]MBU2201025.1 FAD-binding oxidoreductase [Gammaproteobacteria bacterium]